MEPTQAIEPKDRIIVALDVDILERAKSLIEILAPHVGCFKVGKELATAVGAPQVVEFIHGLGGQVFLDGKFNDIPNTVGAAAKAAAGLNVKMFNVHASCGHEAMQAAAASKGDSLLLAVTVLTSFDDEGCMQVFGSTVKTKVLNLAFMAKESGCDGLICSPKDLSNLAKAKIFDQMMKVTPGIRPAWAAANDQKRVMAPGDAILAGATHLVIGRPITKPPVEIGSPVEAAKRIAEEIYQAGKMATA